MASPVMKHHLSPQAELQTERQKVVLFDSSSTPISSLAPGARHDFIVAHDVKEVGPSLTCHVPAGSRPGPELVCVPLTHDAKEVGPRLACCMPAGSIPGPALVST